MTKFTNTDDEIRECLWAAAEWQTQLVGQDIEGFIIEPYRPEQAEFQVSLNLANAIGWASR